VTGYEAVHVPLKSVGVQGDGRTYRHVAALRGPLDYDRLQAISSQLCNVGTTFNRVIIYIAGRAKALADGQVRPATMTRPRLETLREADWIARTVMEEEGITESVWQFPVAILPFFYGNGETVVLRPVNSTDGMTAKFGRLPAPALQRIADRIAALPGVGAVFLDVTDKPPATIEWE
jgi:GMP synthase (glutamine-hydrolysing)